MQKDKIDNIKIYSQYSVIQDILVQTCEHLIETLPHSSLTFTALNTPSISIIDVENQIVFEKIIKLYLEFPPLYPSVLLIANSVKPLYVSESSLIAVLFKPLEYQSLLKIVSFYTPNFIYRLSNDIFLNTKTFSAIKIMDQARAEIKLTQLEYKILKYFIEAKMNNAKAFVTEHDILTDVFGYNTLSNTCTLKTHMHRLKQKLGKNSNIIERKDNGYKIHSS